MFNWSNLVAGANVAQLAVFGQPITYVPKGAGDPFATTAILDKPQIEESASPGYFADIHVDPLQVVNPGRGDEVVWGDGVTYLVTKVLRPDQFSLVVLALHRKYDP